VYDYDDVLRVLRNQGMRARYQYEMAGHNYRLTDLQAAVVIHQVAGLEQVVAARQKNAARLTAGLADVPGIRTPAQLPGRRHVWHQYTVLVDEGSPVDRDTLLARLTTAGVGSGVYYPKPVYDYDCYRDHPRVVIEPTPVAASVSRRCLSLPVHQHLTDDEIDQVIDAVRAAMEA
jgi:dTDP-4-amino-4,6-dideoxygalactose transaminase